MKLLFENFTDRFTGTYFQYHDVVNGSAAHEHTHNFYEVFVVMSGSLIHAVNGTEQTLKTGDIVFIRPRDSHVYKSSQKGKVLNVAFVPQIMEGITLLYNRERLDDIMDSDNPVIRHCGNETVKSFQMEIRRISAMVNKSPQWEFALKDLIYKLFRIGVLGISQDEAMPEWLYRLKEQMENPENFSKGTARLYELAEKSPEHVSRQMKQYIHKTPTEFVNSLRLNYARNRLVITDSSVVDICFDAGFNNLNYFYMLFTKQYGVPPQAYRKLNKASLC